MKSENIVAVTAVPGASFNPLPVFQTMLDFANLWINEVQRADTSRAEIAAWENVHAGKISAQRDVLLKALDLSFDERRENFGRLFDGLDRAIALGDAALASSFLESITDLARESPFKELSNLEITVAELKRPDQVWDI